MSRRNFDVFDMRIPSPEEWDDEIVKELMEKYPDATVGDILHAESENVMEELIRSGRIFKYPPKELFWGLGDAQMINLKERLGLINFSDYLDFPYDIRKEIRTWMRDYHEFMYLLSLKVGFTQLPIKNITTKQQILLFHYLHEAKYIDIQRFPKDNTSATILLSSLFNRSYESLYKEYSQYQNTSITKTNNSSLYTLTNLKSVKEIFLQSKMDDVVALVEKDIKKISATKK